MTGKQKEPPVSKKLSQKVKRLRWLVDEKERLEEELKVIHKERDRLRNVEIPTLMEDQDLENAKIADAGSIRLTPQMYISIKKADEEAWIKWLDDNEHSSIVKRTVHHATASSFIKDMIDNGNKLPDFVKITPYTQAALRRS